MVLGRGCDLQIPLTARVPQPPHPHPKRATDAVDATTPLFRRLRPETMRPSVTVFRNDSLRLTKVNPSLESRIAADDALSASERVERRGGGGSGNDAAGSENNGI